MSYEGYIQKLCKNGHLSTYDCYDEEDVCWHCGEKFIWENHVDDTNGEHDGFINMKQFLIQEAKIEKCNLGFEHVINPETYRIPSKKEVKKAQKEARKTQKG